MNDITIDLSKYKELPESYLKSLSGDKVLTFDILDQDGSVVFQASHSISSEDVKERIQEGTRFFIPRESEQKGALDHEIIPNDKMINLAEETSDIYANIRKKGSMTYEEYISAFDQLEEMVQGLGNEDKRGGCLSLLREMEDFEYYTYAHSVNVGMLAMILFHKLGCSKEKVEDLSIAGYLHDIGKLRVPSEIINKAGRLTSDEFSTIMEHTRNGYRILDGILDKDGNKVVPNVTKLTALFHHRKYKNRGYPFREIRDKKSEFFYLDLPEEVRLIAICDMYDAITTSTPYRKGVTPGEGLEYILNISNYHYTIDDVYRFLKPMILTLNKGQGILSEGDYLVLEATDGKRGGEKGIYEFAKLIGATKGFPLEPSVRIFYDASRNKEIRPIEVDLKGDYYRKIARVLKSDRLTDMLNKLYK